MKSIVYRSLSAQEIAVIRYGGGARPRGSGLRLAMIAHKKSRLTCGQTAGPFGRGKNPPNPPRLTGEMVAGNGQPPQHRFSWRKASGR